MKKNQNVKPLLRMSFESMRNALQEHHTEDPANIFMRNDLAMARSAESLICNFATTDPLFLEDSRIGIVKKGTCSDTINLEKISVNPGDVVYLGKGTIIQVGEMSADYDITGMVFEDERLQFAYNGRPPLLYQQYANYRVLHASQEEYAVFQECLDLLWRITQLPYDAQQTINMCIAPMLSFFEECLARQQTQHPDKFSHGQEIFNRFIHLVNEHAQEGHTLDYYADQLCLSIHYLGTIIKKISGETAKVWIDRALVAKAKVMLRHSDKQVAEIANLLGFPNSSFFCRYFKEHTGSTPQEYRNG